MANTNVEIQTISFDVSDPEITKVTITIKHDDPSNVFMKNKYEKTFPARIPVEEILRDHIASQGASYLYW